MRRWFGRSGLWASVALLLAQAWSLAQDSSPQPISPREALQPFSPLIGQWRATGMPEGSAQAKQKGFWTESIAWQWQFKGDEAWLAVEFTKGKYFVNGQLRPLPQKDRFTLTLQTVDKQTLVFEGTFVDRKFTADRTDPQTKQTQRLVWTLLHANRILYRYEVKPADAVTFTRIYQVGATREGEPFATDKTGPECIVSGGLGTMPVVYKGKTYYVCCSGCRTEFNADPEKYIREFEAKQQKSPK
jgi:hypothetical protein